MKAKIYRNRIRRSSSGQGLVEFAFMLPVLILMMVGVLDLGRVFLGYVALTNAAREGARYGIDNPSDTTGIKAQVVTELNGAGLRNFSASNVSVATSSGTAPGNPIAVTVSYPFPMMTVYLFAGLTSIPVNTSATMQIR